MQNYRCWDPANARQVMNTDAENMEDAVFVAVHSDHDLVMVDTTAGRNWDDRSRWTKTPMEFVHDFLSPTRHQVQVAVLGQSGSGKSHFIHWLQLHIPESTEYYVLTIPKAQTSLRGILQQLMAYLPQEQRTKYQSRLETAGDSLSTPDQRKERLLAEIALAIPHVDLSAMPGDLDTVKGLKDSLPALFNDPRARKLWKRPDSIIEVLAEHIASAPQDYQRVEQRREFSADDLPHSAIDINHFSEEARIILSYLQGDDERTALAVRIINASLNEAISHVLNFSGQHLVALMLDVRRYLRQQGKGLILLIEDFAILQGIDVALLQSLIESSGVGDDALCDLRWAMAVTRGYYEGLPDTVKTRMDFVIDMDLPTSGKLSIETQEMLLPFAARYLNAARLERAELRQWYGRHLEDADGGAPPNRCIGCEFRQECHSSFGATADDIGYYPFNERALLSMADRQGVLANDRFNPRRFIKAVLVNVLDGHSNEIDQGRFPSQGLLQEMKGSNMPVTLEDRISTHYRQDFQRLRALQQLWGPENRLIKLPGGLYEAFSLPIPDFEEASATDGATAQSLVMSRAVLSPPPTPTPVEEMDNLLAAIDKWSHGSLLSEPDVRTLRAYVYDALDTFIDWDNLGVGRTLITANFSRNHIEFFHQQQIQRPTPIQLRIPLSDDEASLRQTALALQGLHRFALQGNWNFSGGLEALMALTSCLEEWSQHLIAKFRQFYQATDVAWQPAQIAMEVLVTGAILAGKLSFDSETTTALDALFAPWGDAQTLPPKWRSLLQNIIDKRPIVESLLKGWSSSTKGGQVGNMLAPHLLVPQLKQFLKNPVYTSLPDGVAQGKDYPGLVEIHQRIRRELPRLLQDELDFRCEWYRTVSTLMGPDVPRSVLLKAAKDFQSAYLEAGISLPRSLKDSFDESLGFFEKAQVDSVIRAHSDLTGDDPMRHFPFLARRPANLDGIRQFLVTLDQMQAVAEEQVQAERAKQDGQDAQLTIAMDTIEHRLVELEQLLAQMGSER